MKKKLLAMIMAVAVVASMAACGSKADTTTTDKAAEETTTDTAATADTTEVKDGADVSVILVTMDGLDNHWVNVDKGASAAAKDPRDWILPNAFCVAASLR